MAQNANVALNFMAVDPFSHGITDETDGGTYLSFPNAVNALVAGMGTGSPGCIGIAVGGTNLNGFASTLSTLGNAFPLPNLQRIGRRATAMAQLELTKWDLVPDEKGLNSVMMNSIPTIKALMRSDLLQAAQDAATAFAGTDPLTNLNALIAEKAGWLSQVANAATQAAQAINATGGLPIPNCWRFYAEGNIASKLLDNMPGHDFPLTSIMLFMGNVPDLALLKSILPEPLP